MIFIVCKQTLRTTAETKVTTKKKKTKEMKQKIFST